MSDPGTPGPQQDGPKYRPGDVANGHILGNDGVWRPFDQAQAQAPPTASQAQQPAPKKSHTFRNVFLALCLVGVLFIGGCLAIVGLTANSVDKAIKKDQNQAGGTNHPVTIHPGKAFSIRDFDYDSGWKVGRDALGDLNVTGLKVTNHRGDKDSAIVEIKLWRGKEVLALADCTTEPIQVGTKVTLSCSSADKMPKSYDKVTINDTF
jgi:hypothetical protein